VGIVKRREFPVRLALAAAIVVPTAYLGVMLAGAVHEVGHGLMGLAAGGRFGGFRVGLDGAGQAFSSLPPDASAWQWTMQRSAGSVAGVTVGCVLLVVSSRLRGLLVRLSLIVLGVCLLLMESTYIFQAALTPWPGSDIAVILSKVDAPWLRPVLIATGAIMMLATVWGGTAIVFQALERWLGTGGRLTHIKRAFVLALLGIIPGVLSLAMIPSGLGPLAHMGSAASLYWIRFKPNPLAPRRRDIAVAVSSIWVAVAAVVIVTMVWLRHGVIWSAIGIRDNFVCSPAISPSGDAAAFVAAYGRGDRTKSRIVKTQLHVLNLRTLSSRIAISDVQTGEDSVTWSPDGKAIAFLLPGQLQDGLPLWALSEMNLADGSASELAGWWWYDSPKYSPDGLAVGFIQYENSPRVYHRGGRHDLKYINRATRQIGVIAKDVTEWCWGRDSQEVFFIRQSSVLRKHIASEREQTLLDTMDETICPSHLTRSPDGAAVGVYNGESFVPLSRPYSAASPWFSCKPTRYGFDWSPAGICYLEDLCDRRIGSCLRVYNRSTMQGWLVAIGPFTFARWADSQHIFVGCHDGKIRLYDLAGGYAEVFSMDDLPEDK